MPKDYMCCRLFEVKYRCIEMSLIVGKTMEAWHINLAYNEPPIGFVPQIPQYWLVPQTMFRPHWGKGSINSFTGHLKNKLNLH